MAKAKTTKKAAAGKGEIPKPNQTAINAVSKAIKDNGIKIIDLKFIDLPGTWQHFSITPGQLEYDKIENSIWADGIGFDGSSIRGFKAINESDMILIPDPTTAVVDPACEIPTLSILCDIYDPKTHVSYNRDPRGVARKLEAYLKTTGVADTVYIGPEAEFFLFNNVQFGQTQNEAFYSVDSEEGIWNSGADEAPNLGHKPGYKGGYFPVSPVDTLQDIRSEMIIKMEEAGIPMEVHHHEVATGGQCEIDMRFDTLTKTADNVMMFKYIVKNVAKEHGLSATFMPKPVFDDNGSGMHTHSSLWKGGKPLFFDAKGDAMLSQLAKYYVGGIIKHGKALMALCAPSTNSYKRLVPGFEAPVNLVYSERNRSAACRIPAYSANPKARRVEFRPPDPTANPYLAFSAIVLAGLDGIKNKIDPGKPTDVDLFELSAKQLKKIPTVPASLGEALDALEKDHDFLLQGDVFTKDLIEEWISYKRENEVDPVRLRPHPWEFQLYYSA